VLPEPPGSALNPPPPPEPPFTPAAPPPPPPAEVIVVKPEPDIDELLPLFPAGVGEVIGAPPSPTVTVITVPPLTVV